MSKSNQNQSNNQTSSQKNQVNDDLQSSHYPDSLSNDETITQVNDTKSPQNKTNQNTESLENENQESSGFLGKKIIEQKEQIQNLENQLKNTEDLAKRYLADLQNSQRQHDLEIQQARKSAKKALTNQLLGFLNTLVISFAYKPQTEDETVVNFIQALEGSLEKLIIDLKASDIELLIPKPGQEVDPVYMNILNPGSNSEENSPTIKQVVSVAVKIDGQLIQPASVLI